MSRLLASLAVLAALIALPVDAATPRREFLDALARMNGVPQPPYVEYEVVVRASGAQFYVTRDPLTGNAEYGFSVGRALGNTDKRWNVVVRNRDEVSAVKLGDTYAATRFPGLNATWGGIDDWMRFGINGRVATPEPSPSAQPLASPAATEAPVIAIVHALVAPDYRVSGGGPATCDGGSAARRFYLRARSDPYRHPATDVTVDDATHAICTIRFELVHNDVVDRDGFVELHLTKSAGVYVVGRGEISFIAQPKLGGGRVRIFIDYVGVQFSTSPPPQAFATLAPATPASNANL